MLKLLPGVLANLLPPVPAAFPAGESDWQSRTGSPPAFGSVFGDGSRSDQQDTPTLLASQAFNSPAVHTQCGAPPRRSASLNYVLGHTSLPALAEAVKEEPKRFPRTSSFASAHVRSLTTLREAAVFYFKEVRRLRPADPLPSAREAQPQPWRP